MAFINGALDFASAADELHRLIQPDDADRPVGPVYLLLAHAMALALKAYLRSQGLPTVLLAAPSGHDLQALYEACKTAGLTPAREHRLSMLSVVALLDQSKKRQGVRYFTLAPPAFLELRWSIDVVYDVIALAKDAVLRADPYAESTGPGERLDFIVEKPTPVAPEIASASLQASARHRRKKAVGGDFEASSIHQVHPERK